MSTFIAEHRERFGVEPICSTLGVSASAFYERASGRRSARQVEDEQLLARIEQLHQANYCAYGYRRTWKALLRAGENVGRDRVKRLMRQNGIQGAKRRGKPWRTTKSDPTAARPADLVQRDFTASRPDEKWYVDFTYLRCWEGLVFFSFVIDAYSRRIVGWQFAPHMRTTLVLDALRMALHQRAPGADVALIHHGDAGSQYLAYDYTQTLDDHGVLASIGTVGDALDNAVAESFAVSRPSSSPTAPGRPDHSSSSPSSSTSPGSTTSACTKRSRTARHEKSRNSTLRKWQPRSLSNEDREPTKTLSVEPGMAPNTFVISGWATMHSQARNAGLSAPFTSRRSSRTPARCEPVPLRASGPTGNRPLRRARRSPQRRSSESPSPRTSRQESALASLPAERSGSILRSDAASLATRSRTNRRCQSPRSQLSSLPCALAPSRRRRTGYRLCT